MDEQEQVAVARDAAGHWLAGQSGHPSGRPQGRSLMAVVRKACGADGKRLVDCLVCIGLGDVHDARVMFGAKSPPVRTADRVRACEILLEYGFGKPPVTIQAAGVVLTEQMLTDSRSSLAEKLEALGRRMSDSVALTAGQSDDGAALQ